MEEKVYLHNSASSCPSDLQQPESSGSVKPPEGNSQLGWEEQAACPGSEQPDSCDDSAPVLLDRLHSLAEAEKLFDELTQEKLQVRRTQCSEPVQEIQI